MINNKTLLFCATSFLSGLLLNDSNKHQSNQLKLPSFRNILEVRSAIKGRIRLYIPMLKNNEGLSKQVLDQLKGSSVIKHIEINTITGTLLIFYEQDKIEPHVVEGAVIKLLGLDNSVNKEEVSLLEKELRMVMSAANKAVLDKTGGFIDAKYMLVVWFVVISLFKLIKEPVASLNPFSLLWWSFNIALRGNHHA